MANEEHLALLKQGVEAWNTWRKRNPEEQPDLSGANLRGASLSEANLREANLNLANLSGADLSEADLRKADLSGGDFTGADFSRAYLIRADVVRANLSGADLSGADLIRAHLRKADLSQADLSRANLIEADLSGAELGHAYLNGASLSGAELADANLSGANLTKANLSGANLSGASLNEANLIRADLSGADLVRADLTRSNLIRADLTKANLSEANLSEAQALSTCFMAADLTGACIANWRIDPLTQLQGATCHYVYLKHLRQLGYTERCPSDPDLEFAPGEFVQRFQTASATVDLSFQSGINWKAFFQCFQDLRAEYGKENLAIQTIERKGNTPLMIRLEVGLEVDRPAIEHRAHTLYDKKLQALEAEYRESSQMQDDQMMAYRQKSADMTEIAKLLASILIL